MTVGSFTNVGISKVTFGNIYFGALPTILKSIYSLTFTAYGLILILFLLGDVWPTPNLFLSVGTWNICYERIWNPLVIFYSCTIGLQYTCEPGIREELNH